MPAFCALWGPLELPPVHRGGLRSCVPRALRGCRHSACRASDAVAPQRRRALLLEGCSAAPELLRSDFKLRSGCRGMLWLEGRCTCLCRRALLL